MDLKNQNKDTNKKAFSAYKRFTSDLETYRLKKEWKKMNKSDKPLIKLIMKKEIGPKSTKSEMKKKLQWISQKYKRS